MKAIELIHVLETYPPDTDVFAGCNGKYEPVMYVQHINGDQKELIIVGGKDERHRQGIEPDKEPEGWSYRQTSEEGSRL